MNHLINDTLHVTSISWDKILALTITDIPFVGLNRLI